MLKPLLILATLAAANGEEFVNLVEELVKDGGKWVLASLGTSGEWPLNESCVTVTITDTGNYSNCILGNHDTIPHKAKIITVHGRNENNKTELIAEGPVHQYMIKGYINGSVHEKLRNEVDWDTALNAPFCWNGDIQDNDIHTSKFVIVPIDKTKKHLMLAKVAESMPAAEYQIVILTKTKIAPAELDKMTTDVNYRNHLCMVNSCPLSYNRQDPLYSSLPPYCLPKARKMCAEGSHWLIESKPIQTTINKIPTDVKELETILVKHLPR